MSWRPDVSIVIPTRDRWPLLSRNALPSALSQRDVASEVIVVDDGSTDETPAGLVDLDAPQLRILRFRDLRGVAKARNAGVEAARGDWVAFLDDDDIWSPQKLRTQLDAASAATASFVICASATIDNAFRPLQLHLPPRAEDLMAELLRIDVVPGGCSGAIVRTDAVRQAGGFDEALSILADWDLWIRLCAAEPVAVCEEILVGKLLHEANMIVVDRGARALERELDYLTEKHGALLRAHHADFDRRGMVRWARLERRHAERVAAEDLRRVGRRGKAAAVYFRSGIRNLHVGSLVWAAAVLFGGPAVRTAEFARTLLRSPLDPEQPSWLALYRKSRHRMSLVER